MSNVIEFKAPDSRTIRSTAMDGEEMKKALHARMLYMACDLLTLAASFEDPDAVVRLAIELEQQALEN